MWRLCKALACYAHCAYDVLSRGFTRAVWPRTTACRPGRRHPHYTALTESAAPHFPRVTLQAEASSLCDWGGSTVAPKEPSEAV